MDSHVFCYTEGAKMIGGVSVCDLGPTKFLKVYRCIALEDIFSKDIARQFVEVGRTCAGEILSDNVSSGNMTQEKFEEAQRFRLNADDIEKYLLKNKTKRKI